MFTRAIVRIPGSNFASGLTTVDFGVPSFDLVLSQHDAYCQALVACGLSLTTLPPDLHHPDSTFVEDTAILTPGGAILTRPGAASRAGEVDSIRLALHEHYPSLLAIHSPGTVDGGDICEAGSHFFIGISHRTNSEGARQLAAHLAALGYTSSTIDVRSMTSILHLKSGVSYIEDNSLVVIPELASHPGFAAFRLISVAPAESYAANCIRVNDRVLIASGYPQLHADLRARGFDPLTLDMTEFRKMDGGLSCLSLRF